MKQAANKKTKRSSEVEREKCEIVPSLQKLHLSQLLKVHQCMYASNVSYYPVSLGDDETGSLQQQHSSVKEEEKCEVAASQLNSSHERSGGNISNDCHNVQSGHG